MSAARQARRRAGRLISRCTGRVLAASAHEGPTTHMLLLREGQAPEVVRRDDRTLLAAGFEDVSAAPENDGTHWLALAVVDGCVVLAAWVRAHLMAMGGAA